MRLRSNRRDRAARNGPEQFLYRRVFDDCLERVALAECRYGHALMIGCPDLAWPIELRRVAGSVNVCDPGALFAVRAGGEVIIEDSWDPPKNAFDLAVAIGTLDTVNELPIALRLVRHAMRKGGLFLGAMSGGDTLPRLRAAMRAADAVTGVASPHIHPRVEAAALAPLLSGAGFDRPVVDVERVQVAYRSLGGLVADLRAMGATNVLVDRPRFMSKRARAAAEEELARDPVSGRFTETFEILHFAAWATE